jgi:beta-phosphoglucomutase
MDHFFDAVADGNQIQKSKPNPEVFLLEARKLGVAPEDCVVIEDAASGIEAALAGGMKAVGVGSAASYPEAHYAVKDLTCISAMISLKLS